MYLIHSNIDLKENYMNINEKVGRNIKKYRMAYNLTLKDLSKMLHKSVSTISKYENGMISLDISTLLEMSRIFQISPLMIIGNESHNTNDSHIPETNIIKNYMYSYDGSKKKIIKSIIERHETSSDICHALLFNDVAESENPGACNGFYSGEFVKDGFLGTYMLHNQISKSEHIIISCVNNLVNPGQKLALVSGLSNYTMLPVTFKAVILDTEISNLEKIQPLLSFSKEDFKQMKQTNTLTLQNL